MGLNDDLLNFQIQQQVRWLRLANNDAREARTAFLKTDPELRAYIMALDVRPSPRGIRTVAKDVKNILTPKLQKITDDMTLQTLDTSNLAAEIEHQLLDANIPSDVKTQTKIAIDKSTFETPYQGALLAAWLADLRGRDIARTQRGIIEGLISDDSNQDIASAVIGTRSLNFKDGAREVSRRNAEMAIRTAISHATNMGRQAIWEANISLIDNVRWVSTLDGRTSAICQHRDGRLYPVLSGPRPPAHSSCRSVTVAVVKSWRELGFDVDDLPPGKRASMNGEVPSTLTYQEWFLQQPTKFQKEVLGPTRFKLWQKSGIAPTRFHNDAGFYYTIPELKKKMPTAFDKLESVQPA